MNQTKCECYDIAHTVLSIISSKIERKYIKESSSPQYVQCKCKLCGREWDEK